VADVLHGLFDAFGGRGLEPISVMPCPRWPTWAPPF